MAKQVFLTGGAKNLGNQTARLFAQRGWDVHLTSRSAEEAEAAAKAIADEFGVQAYGYGLDIACVADIRRVFAEVKKKVGALDAFVANAAQLGVGCDIFHADEETYDAVMNTNVKGTFFCCQEAGRLLAVRGGSIVLVSSVQSKAAIEGRTVYGMSKGAINTLSQYLAYELAPFQVRSNVLIAGAIHTPRWDALDEEVCRQRRANYPLGREADGEDIAQGIYYLASEESRYVTGTELTVDSGVLVSLLPYRDRKQPDRDEYLR